MAETRPANVATAVGTIVVENGRLLLGRRSPDRVCCPGLWDLPGGHVERGETVCDTVGRELVEEFGIVPIRVAIIDTLELPDVGGKPMSLSIALVSEWTGVPAIRDSEHVAFSWFTPEAAAEIPDLAVGAYRPLFAGLRLG